jgi:GntR family transcriptional regulator
MRQVRTIRYREIAGDLGTRIAAGEFTVGRLLPSEAVLSAEYSVSRVTIRKALEELRGDGLVDSRQGFGWFVAGEAVRQPLGGLVTIESQLEAEGRVSERRILDLSFERTPPEVRSVLDVDRVLVVNRLNLADGEPFARVTVWCPEELGAHLTLAQLKQRSFYELLPVQFAGATQVIGADAASEEDARLLLIPPGSPVLVCKRTTRDHTGKPVLVGQYVFPAHRTEFVVELSRPEPSIGPGGLHLRG